MYTQLLLTASADKTIKKWELNSDGSPKRHHPVTKLACSEATFNGHTDWVSCLVVVDGSMFSGSWDRSIEGTYLTDTQTH